MLRSLVGSEMCIRDRPDCWACLGVCTRLPPAQKEEVVARLKDSSDNQEAAAFAVACLDPSAVQAVEQTGPQGEWAAAAALTSPARLDREELVAWLQSCTAVLCERPLNQGTICASFKLVGLLFGSGLDPKSRIKHHDTLGPLLGNDSLQKEMIKAANALGSALEECGSELSIAKPLSLASGMALFAMSRLQNYTTTSQATAVLNSLPMFKRIYVDLSQSPNGVGFQAVSILENKPALVWAPLLQPWLVGPASCAAIKFAVDVLLKNTATDRAAVCSLLTGLLPRLLELDKQVSRALVLDGIPALVSVYPWEAAKGLLDQVLALIGSHSSNIDYWLPVLSSVVLTLRELPNSVHDRLLPDALRSASLQILELTPLLAASPTSCELAESSRKCMAAVVDCLEACFDNKNQLVLATATLPQDGLVSSIGIKNQIARCLLVQRGVLGSSHVLTSSKVHDNIPLVCCYWLQNQCSFGDKCKHMHLDKPGVECQWKDACLVHKSRANRSLGVCETSDTQRQAIGLSLIHI
eukprot:TRINITY_DN36912_c0_g1_i1.p1 TRINITY_DN36912_c0_g1~~TRINITY_DN36912_c0_g1_i1.p1  ORF type:complete len:544 (+),score=88.08 TRINITY_DN36912_c0_g1_i1:60-1634(+)